MVNRFLVLTVLGECCSLTGKPGHDAREVVSNVFDSVVQEKGIRTAFSKLLSEEYLWVEKVCQTGSTSCLN